jgi:hypothetical protein
MSVNTREFELIFAEHKQSAIGTALTISELTKNLPFRDFAPFTMNKKAMASDRAQYGKGHSFPTYIKEIQKDYLLPARGYDMTQLSAVVFPAFVLGSESVTQPDSAASPTTYDVELTFQDQSNVDAIPTSLIELYDAKRMLGGVFINSFSVAAAKEDHAVLSWEGFCRELATNSDTLPALATSQNFFKLLKSTFTFGAGAGADVSTDVEAFNLTVSQNLNIRHNPGASAGEEDLISAVHIGDQTVSGSLQVYAGTTLRNLMLNHTECILTVVFDSGVIIEDAYTYLVTVSIPNLYLASEAHNDDAQTGILTLNFTDETVIKAASDDFITWTVRTNEDHANLLTTP